MYEAIGAGIATVICITEGVPAHEMLRIHAFIEDRDVRLVGPNAPARCRRGKPDVGIIPAEIFREGSVGLSRSGRSATSSQLQPRLSPARRVGIGGDPVVGSSFTRARAVPEPTPNDRADRDGRAARRGGRLIGAEMSKPVVTSRGFTAPPGKTMGTPARSSRVRRTAQAKKEASRRRACGGTTPRRGRADRRRDRRRETRRAQRGLRPGARPRSGNSC